MPRISGVAAFFLVDDVVAAAEYYRDKLGFSIVGYFFEEPPVFAMVGRDDQILMLRLMTASGRGGSNRNYLEDALDAYLWTDDVDALHDEFRHNGADVVTPPQLRIYGMKELEVRDLDGYVLCFGQDMSPRQTGEG